MAAKKENDRSDKFTWIDGDLKIIYNPNDKKKKPADKKPAEKKPENKAKK